MQHFFSTMLWLVLGTWVMLTGPRGIAAEWMFDSGRGGWGYSRDLLNQLPSEELTMRPGSRLVRGVRLAELREIHLRFAFGENTGPGWRIGLRHDADYLAIAARGDGMLAMTGFEPHYAGPRWRAGQEMELRLSFVNEMLSVAWAPLNGLPRPIKAYTRTLPREWLTGEVELFVEYMEDDEAAGGAINLSTIVYYAIGESMPDEVTVSATIAESLLRFAAIRNGELTPAMTAFVREARKTVATAHMLLERFEVQAWDGAKLLRGGKESERLDLAAEYYTMLQFRDELPPTQVIAAMQERNLRLSLYLSTREERFRMAVARSPHVATSILVKGQRRPEVDNLFSGDFTEVAAIGTVRATLDAMRTGIFTRLMLDSEAIIRPGNDALTQAAAVMDGVPIYHEAPELPGDGIMADDDPAFQSLRWISANSSFHVRHMAIARLAHQLSPRLAVTSDPIDDSGRLEQFSGLDSVQHWVRIHSAPRHPRSLAYWLERGRVHVRNGSPNSIMIGPQLGRNEVPAPPDMVSEACWLAAGFGARGITHWGQQAIFQTDGSFQPGGEALWQRLIRLRNELYEPHEALLLRWQPTPRRLAMLVSNANLITRSGGRHSAESAMENAYRAILATGEPCDIIYDQEILDHHALSRYRAVIVPALHVANRSLVERLRAYGESGGTLITHRGSVLDEAPGVKLLEQELVPRYRDYWITNGEPSLEPHQYADFLSQLTRNLREMLPFTPAVQLDRDDVVANLMADGERRFLVLINGARDYGDFTRGAGHRWMLDAGKATIVRVHMDGVTHYSDLSSGNSVEADIDGVATLSLQPGWGAILQLSQK